MQIRVAGRTDSGTKPAMDLVERIRDRYVPAARFPSGTEPLLTGAPAFGVDFIDKAYGAFPWLVLAVLVVSYLILLRAFRSVVLPLKAVVMNLLSVGAAYGVLVLVFQHGWGESIGLQQSPQIEAWIPIFLFAVLFGLSMDYEVFLLSRVREEWERRHDNEAAVAYGLEHTGRIITAAAIIMIAAFAGFSAGSFVGLQEFGHRAVGGDLPRRHRGARDPRPGDDEAAREVELVHARTGAPRAAPEPGAEPVIRSPARSAYAP